MKLWYFDSINYGLCLAVCSLDLALWLSTWFFGWGEAEVEALALNLQQNWQHIREQVRAFDKSHQSASLCKQALDWCWSSAENTETFQSVNTPNCRSLPSLSPNQYWISEISGCRESWPNLAEVQQLNLQMQSQSEAQLRFATLRLLPMQQAANRPFEPWKNPLAARESGEGDPPLHFEVKDSRWSGVEVVTCVSGGRYVKVMDFPVFHLFRASTPLPVHNVCENHEWDGMYMRLRFYRDFLEKHLASTAKADIKPRLFIISDGMVAMSCFRSVDFLWFSQFCLYVNLQAVAEFELVEFYGSFSVAESQRLLFHQGCDLQRPAADHWARPTSRSSPSWGWMEGTVRNLTVKLLLQWSPRSCVRLSPRSSSSAMRHQFLNSKFSFGTWAVLFTCPFPNSLQSRSRP